MAEKKTVLTYDGLKRMEDELQDLKVNRRKEVAEKIKDARGQGDLSENAEYDAAKEEQAEIEARIVILEKMLRNAEVIDEEDLNKEIVGVGSTVRIFDNEYDEEVVYTIVGSAEADPLNGKISNESPLGAALLGKAKDEIFVVEAPDGALRYKVLEIH
ncbi:MAG: transcription elongation factor GreA [Defluviitaleaceae bacterium]|nr:transcription elongation factor GreA [Defluviitaleaceae bacterium]